jgi:hypothetical protein
VTRGSTWNYFQGTQEASSPDVTEWRAVEYDDTSWLSGPAPVGYGENMIQTDVSTLDPPMRNNYNCLFLRQAFPVDSPGDVVTLHAAINYDDGLVMWINGEEVLRPNMPDDDPPVVGTDAGATWALGNHEQGTYEEFELPVPADYLVSGTNVVAIQIFNNQIASSDCVLDLELRAVGGGTGEAVFRRGDANSDGLANIADAVYILQNLFAQGPAIRCPDAGDANDDEDVNIADAVYLLQNLFAQGAALPAPGRDQCGPDTTPHPTGGQDLPACTYCAGACETPAVACP